MGHGSLRQDLKAKISLQEKNDLMIQCKLDPLTTSFVLHKNICMVEDRWTASGKQAITNHLLLKWMQRSRK